MNSPLAGYIAGFLMGALCSRTGKCPWLLIAILSIFLILQLTLVP